MDGESFTAEFAATPERCNSLFTKFFLDAF